MYKRPSTRCQCTVFQMSPIARYAEEHTIEFKEYFEGDAPEHYYNAAVIAVKIGD